MARPTARKHPLRQLASFGLVLLIVASASASYLRALGDDVPNRSLKLSDATVSVTATYNFTFNIRDNSSLGSIAFEFCSNDPIVGAACTAPSGFDATQAVLASQAGNTGFSLAVAPTSNRIVISRATAAANLATSQYVFDQMVNPDTAGSYYVRIATYGSTDATGPLIEKGGLAFAITGALNVRATVPPFLIFCLGLTIPGLTCAGATGNYINFGNLLPTAASHGTTQLLTATNAGGGYALRVVGTTLTSGNNVITAAASDVSRPGTSQFGMNLRANSAPQVGQDKTGPGSGVVDPQYNQPNFFRFASGEVIATSDDVDEATKYTASYIVNVSRNQAPGVYVSTLTYVCLANF